MKLLNKLGILLFLSITLFSCDDIFEEDLSDNTLITSSPLEGDIIESNVVNFKWEALEGADKYRVEVYDDLDVKILDTLLVNKTNLVYPISQGSYKWKARGENFAYQSKYSTLNNFSMIETLDLTNQQVILNSPSSDFYTNATSINCIWQDLTAADTYDLELNNITSGMQVLQQSGILNPNFTINSTYLSSEAKYQWKVKAKNTTSETVFASRTFFIDRIVPNTPQITSPVNNSTQVVNQNINFNWNSGTDTGTVQSPISYVIEFSNASDFGSLLHTSTVSTLTYQKSFSASGDYYWRVKAVDAATNMSSYSTVFKFSIN